MKRGCPPAGLGPDTRLSDETSELASGVASAHAPNPGKAARDLGVSASPTLPRTEDVTIDFKTIAPLEGGGK